jgi:hypothetical protein
MLAALTAFKTRVDVCGQIGFRCHVCLKILFSLYCCRFLAIILRFIKKDSLFDRHVISIYSDFAQA